MCITTLLLLVVFCRGQAVVNIILFDFDEDQLNQKSTQALEQCLMYYNPDSTALFQISGHTDSIGSRHYNRGLSQRRVQSVVDYLISKGHKEKQITSSPYGEDSPQNDNGTPQGRALNRRVELSWYWPPVIPPKLVASDSMPIPPADIPTQKILCDRDTVIRYPNGTRLVMNKCEFEKDSACIRITEMNTPEAMRQSGWSTYSEDGTPLVSGGMFNFQTCDGSCLETPITILVPVQTNCRGADIEMQEWTRNADGSWGARKPLQIVERMGARYYEFKIRCPGGKNADYKPVKPPKTKIKLKDGLKIIEAKVLVECPMGQYNGKVKKWRKNIAKFRLKCPTSGMQIYCKAMDKEGNTIEMNWTYHEDVEFRESCHRCKNDSTIRKVLGLVRVKEKTMYRKYILFKEDFKATKDQPVFRIKP